MIIKYFCKSITLSYAVLSVKIRKLSILKYIFKNKKLTPELKHYISKVWKSFSNLLKVKLNLLNSNVTHKEYTDAYSKFRDEFHIHKEYYYSKIYVQTHEFDDEIKQIRSILF